MMSGGARAPAASRARAAWRRVVLGFFFSSGRRHTSCYRDWSSDVCSSDLVAAELADFFVLSSDDPLHEDPHQIAAQIAAGAEARNRRQGQDYLIEVDRAAAIRTLLRRAWRGDTVLLAGKGHEQRMLVGDDRLPWNDRQEAE